MIRRNWRGRAVLRKNRMPKPEDNKISWADWFYEDRDVRRRRGKIEVLLGHWSDFEDYEGDR